MKVASTREQAPDATHGTRRENIQQPRAACSQTATTIGPT